MSTPTINTPGSDNSKPQGSVSDVVNYVSQNPGILGTVYSGIRALVTLVALLLKPGIKSPK